MSARRSTRNSRLSTDDSGRGAEDTPRHDFEAVAPPHDWWDWYAAYLDARRRGSSPDEASASAGPYLAEVKYMVVPAT
ncbi:MAG: bleomycin resistance protein [Actinomycetota bacterium]|nr:bleomycin resistance protein [Actinomycetota bacterium]